MQRTVACQKILAVIKEGFATSESESGSTPDSQAAQHWKIMRHSKHLDLAMVLWAVFLALSATATRAQFATPNLLVNPGAETGDLTGWTISGVSNPSVDNGSFDTGISPRTGTYDFYGHTGAYGYLSQTVALAGNQGITTAMIDSGVLFAEVSFWEQGLNQGTPSDDGNVSITFYNASSNVISSLSTPVIDSHLSAWENFSGLYGIPAGTRFIQYQMSFNRNDGNDLDAFFDDNSLIVTDNSSLPYLAIAAVGTNAVITWPTNADNFALYSTTNLSNPSWNAVTNLPAIVGTNLVVYKGLLQQQFFRLQLSP